MWSMFKGKYLAAVFGLLLVAVFLKIILFNDGIEIIKRTILNPKSIIRVSTSTSRNTYCSQFASIYEKTVGYLNKNTLFHYEKEFTLRCLKRMENRVLVRTYLPGFRFKSPRFVDSRSEYLFHKNPENTIYLRVQPIPRFTEVLFLRNGIFESDKFCGYKGAFDWIIQNKQNQSNTRNLGRPVPAPVLLFDGVSFPTEQNESNTSNLRYSVLAPALSFDGFSFQHFLDGTIHLLVQILPFIQDKTVKILTYTPRDRIIFDFMETLNISRSQIVFYKKGIQYHADLMIHSCIYDRLHPLLWHEVRTNLGVQNNLAIEIDKAFIVLITRDGCFNCGRRLLNQNATVNLLQMRYGSEFIKLFKGPKALNVSKEIFSKARIIIGPHGGGLYNMVFAPYGTTVIEFMPTRENGDTGIPGHQIFWKIANNLHHSYWRVALKQYRNNNMLVNLEHLSKLLDLVDQKT